ncbi:hypothetical protein [uncultured Campylobacter sp.]|uniref:hypothetical protein n=1 Tax=uncultured Campylobacter sp. TaxID=218934 RepID=UPI00260B851B|nr:hypothetical protein [uncultured Campylobacter sp.]
MRQATEILTTFNKVDGILPQQLWHNSFNIASGAIWRSKGLPREIERQKHAMKQNSKNCEFQARRNSEF